MSVKGFTIVVAGKGGTGKTLTSALLVRHQQKHGSVLVIDADPDSNMPEVLGVEVTGTVGDAREGLLDYKTRQTETVATTPDKLFEQKVMESIAEEQNFDLLVMGRSEGEGCYCAVNHILRAIIDTQAKNYPTVIIDSEAGLEHISRRTARDVDLLLVVTDASARGMHTAQRVATLAKELRVDFGRVVVLVNKVTDSTRPIMEKHAVDAGLDLVGFLPYDPQVAENDVLGKPIWDLADDEPVLKAAKDVFTRLDEIREERQGKISTLG